MLEKFFGQALIYGLGAVASSGVSFLLLPVYTRHLSPAEYGQLETLNALGQILLIFFAAGVASSFFAVHFRLCQDDVERERLLKTALYGLILLSTPQALLAALAARWLAPALGVPLAWLWLVVAAQWAAAIGLFPFAVLRARQQAAWFVLLTLIQLAALLGLNIYHVAVAGLGVAGVLRSQLIVYGTTTLVTILVVLRRFGMATRFRHLKRLVQWGYTNVPNSLAGWTTNLADRYFLLAYLGVSHVGIYAVGYKLGMILQIVLVMPLTVAWAPFLQSIAERPDVKRIVARVFAWVVLVACLFWAGLGLAARPLVQILAGADYAEAAAITPIVLLAYVFAAMTPILASGINLAQKYHWFIWIGLATALANLAFNAWLIPSHGSAGAAWATVATYALSAALTWVVSQRLVPVPFALRPALACLVIGAVLFARLA